MEPFFVTSLSAAFLFSPTALEVGEHCTVETMFNRVSGKFLSNKSNPVRAVVRRVQLTPSHFCWRITLVSWRVWSVRKWSSSEPPVLPSLRHKHAFPWLLIKLVSFSEIDSSLLLLTFYWDNGDNKKHLFLFLRLHVFSEVDTQWHKWH